ncbi:uncharacterized protein MAL13P1.304-like [Leptopilina boulardi]|uniref:uncharacterized protein MAL13P1.304-like n=1 Tax=Leptopilina boulardi TaxID=63433 RepID=UPI0021F55D04|nr:uncharacterized protein MAL13P1.304-like [Leptopilina boulardi]XP_051155761.1 uncharacterized protein MAL13P1.304-like [Leptopilina boulardi]XP_051155762.1 uncharacterized protein MAL13P1.304-like [Leptopilina boulardi]
MEKEKIVERHFYQWRVFLNDRGELLIKGLLNNEIWSRSKPVAEMLLSKQLKSKYQHIYHLHGCIIDEKNELPKYIYQKFYNGFPDDWRNVHAIWKNYIAQGSKENFHWPMNFNYINDNSEITDNKQMQKTEKKFQELNFMEKSTPQQSSDYNCDFQHERNKKIVENHRNNINMKKNQSIQINRDSQQFSEKENKNLHENQNQFNVTDNRSYSGNLYTALNYALELKDTIFQDKLTIITQNLLHDKCPKQYVQCVSKTIEYLNNIISVKIDELDESKLKYDQPSNSKRKVDSNEKNDSNEINKNLMRQITIDKIEQRNSENKINENLMKKSKINNEKPINLKFDKNSENNEMKETNSECEIYAGVHSSVNDEINKISSDNEHLSKTKIKENRCINAVQQQNLPANDLNKHKLQQKPRIIKTEIVNFSNFRKSLNHFSSSEQKVNQCSKETNSQIIDQNSEEKIGENWNQDSFGSQENPKLLKNWNPLVTFGGKKCYLTFEGTLLKTAGQLMKKKFTTSQVIKRISSNVIETADYQFYKLVGEINIKKKVVPKELLPQCRTGCPVNIDEFCATWLKLKGDDERVIAKDGDTVFKSGNPKEKFVTSMVGSPSKCRKSPEKVVTTNETEKDVLSAVNDRNVKNKVARKLKFESGESKEEKTKTINTRRSHLYALRKRRRIIYNENDDDDNDVNVGENSPSHLTPLRKRRRIIYTDDDNDVNDGENFPEKIKNGTEKPKQL